MGKVEFLDLSPLSFFEFMMAMDKGQYVELLQKGDFDMATAFKQDYIDLLKHYYYVGGMPEVQPKLSIRTSMVDYKKEDWLFNLPLWAVGAINCGFLARS